MQQASTITLGEVVKLSNNQRLFLTAISDKTIDTEGMELYWTPFYTQYLSSGETLMANGGGDVSTLRSLEKKGLIVRPDGTPQNFRYAYRITDEGREALEAQQQAR